MTDGEAMVLIAVFIVGYPLAVGAAYAFVKWFVERPW